MDIIGYNALRIGSELPFDLVYWGLVSKTAKAVEFGLSSVPGPADGFCFHGMKTKGWWGAHPAFGENICNADAFFLNNTVGISIQLDKYYVSNPELFV